MIYLGIDPGNTGAIAAIHPNGLVSIWDMPLNYNKDFVDCVELSMLLKNPGHIFLEQVASRPTDGRSSLAKFMICYGAIRACVAISAQDATLVLPQVWKRALGLLKQPKEASIELARSLYPDASPSLKRKKDHNRAEALLIAHYGKSLNE